MTWSSWGVPGVLGFVAACAAAAVAFKTAPSRPLNRRLTGLLLIEAVFIGCTTGFVLFVGSEGAAFWIGALGVAAMTALPFQYLRFLGISLETPLVAPFRGRCQFGCSDVLGWGCVPPGPPISPLLRWPTLFAWFCGLEFSTRRSRGCLGAAVRFCGSVWICGRHTRLPPDTTRFSGKRSGEMVCDSLRGPRRVLRDDAQSLLRDPPDRVLG